MNLRKRLFRNILRFYHLHLRKHICKLFWGALPLSSPFFYLGFQNCASDAFAPHFFSLFAPQFVLNFFPPFFSLNFFLNAFAPFLHLNFIDVKLISRLIDLPQIPWILYQSSVQIALHSKCPLSLICTSTYIAQCGYPLKLDI